MAWGVEQEDSLGCSDCGRPVSQSSEVLYAFGADSVLCFDCACRRGGTYDPAAESWRRQPEVTDLLRKFEEANL